MLQKKRSWLRPAVLLPIAFAVQSAMATPLSPTDDTYTRGGQYSQADYATQKKLVVRNARNDEFDRKSYLAFDLDSSSLANIEKATLRLYVRKIKKNTSLNILQGEKGWFGSLNWDSAPAANLSAGVATLPLTSKQSRSWVEVDVTKLAKTSSNGQLSLIIENPQASKGNGVTFNSLESNKSPQLIINLKTAVSETSHDAQTSQPGSSHTGGQDIVLAPAPQPEENTETTTPAEGHAGSSPATESGDAFDPGLPVVETPDADNQPVADNGVITGTISGLTVDRAVVTASGRGELHTVLANGDSFRFDSLNPEIEYTIKVQAEGLRLKGLVTTRPGENLSLMMHPMPSLIGDDTFHFVWDGEGENVSGLEYASAVNKPVKVTVHGVEKDIPNIAAAQILYRDYNVVLDDSGQLPWTQDHAYRLLETMKQVPQKHCYNGTDFSTALKCNSSRAQRSIWTLTTQKINNDLQINGENITLATDAFTYANPAIATVDGRKGRFFSKRLHHAVVRKVTKNGNDLEMANYILENRFWRHHRYPQEFFLLQPGQRLPQQRCNSS